LFTFIPASFNVVVSLGLMEMQETVVRLFCNSLDVIYSYKFILGSMLFNYKHFCLH